MADDNKPLDHKLSIVQKGNMANVALKYFGEYCQAERARLINEAKNLYRSEKVDQTLMYSKIAALCAIDDLYLKLERDALRSRQL